MRGDRAVRGIRGFRFFVASIWCLVILSVGWGEVRAQGQPQSTGEVLYSDGVGSIQTSGKAPTILGRGVTVHEGDTITTAAGSRAIIAYPDGTRMTVRPESTVVIRTYRFVASPKSEGNVGSMAFELLKGGFRAVTGLISKRDSTAATLRTPSATVGIRGTDLDVRLCTDDCAREQLAAQSTRTARPNTILASARVLAIEGRVLAVAADGSSHALFTGAPVYQGDTVKSDRGAYAVLGFRDQSRTTVAPSSTVQIEEFVFDQKNPQEGRVLLNLVKGGLRALTGLIGQAQHEHVGIHTPTATIGIRGTLFDIHEDEASGFTGSVIDGKIFVTQNSSGESLEVLPGEAVNINTRERLHRVDRNAYIEGPRPDSVDPDWHNAFGEDPLTGTEPGVWMYVRKGPVQVRGDKGWVLDAGDHEVLYFNFDGSVDTRPEMIPLFFDSDDTPDPTHPLHFDLITEIKPSGIDAVCKQ